MNSRAEQSVEKGRDVRGDGEVRDQQGMRIRTVVGSPGQNEMYTD